MHPQLVCHDKNHKEVCADFQSDLNRLEKSSAKANAMSCSWGGRTPGTSTYWDRVGGQKLSRKCNWESWMDIWLSHQRTLAINGWHQWSHQWTGQEFLGIKQSIPSRLREVILPLCSALARHIWGAVSSAGLRDLLQRAQGQATKMTGTGASVIQGEAERAGEGRGISSMCVKILEIQLQYMTK